MWCRAIVRPPTIQRATNRAALSTFRTHQNPRGRRTPSQPIRRTPSSPSSSSSSPQPQPQPQSQSQPHNPEPQETSRPNPDYNPAQNTLLSPVHVPEDPNGALRGDHPATNILANSGLVVQRQLEMMNVMIGFEQANRYVILDAHGNHVGYMAEQDRGMASAMARQWFRTHRGFVTHVFDRHENEVLRFHRPFAWINSHIRVYDPLGLSKSAHAGSPGSLDQIADGSNTRISPLQLNDMRLIGEAQQQWAPLRRKYNLFTYNQLPSSVVTQQGQVEDGEFEQFAYVDEPFLSWDFSLRSAEGKPIGSVNRDFVGFTREIFTDTGVYALRMDSATAGPGANADPAAAIERPTGMTLDQRAIMLASAVSIDFDYFSRHSDSGGIGFLPFFFPFGGEGAAGAGAGEAAGAGAGAGAGEAAGAGAGAGAGGAGGAVGDAAAGAAGRSGAGAGAGGLADGAAAGAAGAGSVAGYDALQRGMSGDATPSNPSQAPPSSQGAHPNEDVWGEEQGQEDPWASNDGWGMGDEEEGGGDSGDFF